MIKTLKGFFSYIINPAYQETQEQTSKFKKLLSLLLLALVFNVIIIIARTFLINKGIIPELFMKNSNPLAGFLFYPLVVLIISPIVEELGFRLFLIPNRINISISLSILLYFLSYFIFPFFMYEINIYLLIPLILFIILLLLTIKSSITNLLNSFIKNHFKIIFYSSTLIFTLIHLNNFWIEKGHIIWLPLVFLPYLMLGLVFGYIRVLFGIKYSILLHFIYNLFPFILSLVFLG